MNVTLYPSHIEVQNYPFSYSGIGKNAIIYPNDISEILFTSTPLAIVYRHKEIIFLDIEIQKFMHFIQVHQLHQSKRPEIWMWLCEDFLDTEHTEEHKNRQLQILAQNNIEAYEVGQIRQEIEPTIHAYNALMWEWVYLGHYDVLRAYKDFNAPKFTASFYWWTMNIALKNYIPIEKPTALSDEEDFDDVR